MVTLYFQSVTLLAKFIVANASGHTAAFDSSKNSKNCF